MDAGAVLAEICERIADDGRGYLLDFGLLLRDIDASHLVGELRVRNALAAGDAQRVHDGLVDLGHLGDPVALEPEAVFELLSSAGAWLTVPGTRRIDPAYVGGVLELAYPPRSPFLGLIRRMRIPAETLLLRRVEAQLLSLLGELNAAADWAPIGAEHHAGAPPSTELGREELAHCMVGVARAGPRGGHETGTRRCFIADSDGPDGRGQRHGGSPMDAAFMCASARREASSTTRGPPPDDPTGSPVPASARR